MHGRSSEAALFLHVASHDCDRFDFTAVVQLDNVEAEQKSSEGINGGKKK